MRPTPAPAPDAIAASPQATLERFDSRVYFLIASYS